MLKFLIDHNVPKSVALFLKTRKFDVKLVKDVNSEMSDVQVVKLAVQEKRIILTNDKDFINLGVKYPKSDIILFDYFCQNPQVRIDGLRKVIDKIQPPFGILVLQ